MTMCRGGSVAVSVTFPWAPVWRAPTVPSGETVWTSIIPPASPYRAGSTVDVKAALSFPTLTMKTANSPSDERNTPESSAGSVSIPPLCFESETRVETVGMGSGVVNVNGRMSCP